VRDRQAIRILVIDDEPFVLKVLTRQLNNLGYTDVVAFTLAQDGLDLLQADQSSFQLVLCDLDMPGMDGIEFLRHLGDMEFAGGLVLISGEDTRILKSAERLAKAHRLNMLGAIAKPVMPAELADVLQRAGAATARGRGGSKRRKHAREELLAALDRCELINHYQPQVAVGSGALVGVEALVRWQHPEDGLVFPGQFIGLAEKHDLMDRLTKTVLVQGLQALADWDSRGLSVKLSVNVSMDSLTNLEFPGFVLRCASEAGLPLTRLVLEVTESRLMKNRLVSLDNLTRLRLKKIGLSIDDFGTGHSSLAQLRDIPFNELKIDQGFTHGASGNPELRSIFEASLKMAKELGMTCVAEGVEDEVDWQFLQGTGCDLAQGYFIAKPMAAEDLPDWHIGWQKSQAGGD